MTDDSHRTSTRSSLAVGVLALLCSSCSWMPGLEDPEFRLEPRMYMYKPTGKARMQSYNLSGGVVNNGTMDLTRFGMNGRDEDYGAVASIGDGFSGLDLGLQRVEVDDTSTGVLTQGYGVLAAGAEVNSELSYNEIRAGYVAEVVNQRVAVDADDELELRLGLGGELVHRDGEFQVEEVAPFTSPDMLESQKIKFTDNGLPYLKLRARGEWRNFALQLDWAYNPDLTFGGEFTGDMHDVEIVASYLLEPQDIRLVAGYRWSDLPISGSTEGLQYDADFNVEGFLIGLSVAF